jgi:putative ATP-binding cassette transporter
MDARDDTASMPGMACRQPAASDGNLMVELKSLLDGLWHAPLGRRLGLLALGLAAVVCGNTVAQIWLNRWQRTFYDALERRDVPEFWMQLVLFAVIAGILLLLVVGQTWFQELIKVRLREWLTRDLLQQWLAPRRAYLLSFCGDIGANPDQRMDADAQHLTELTGDLGSGLLQSTLLLVSFVGVLWFLSDQVVFGSGADKFTIPGYMVWCALAYALSGSWLTRWIGKPLIPLNANRYAQEAELRFALVHVSESAEGFTLYEGEADEQRLLDAALDRVILVQRQLVSGLTRLTWITSGYGWVAIVAPIIVAAPGYFSGNITFGGLMMISGAFLQVQSALRWYVDNFSKLADWRATLLRVVAFRDALLSVDTMGEGTEQIELVEDPEGRVALEGVSLRLAHGRAALDEGSLDVAPGEHVLVTGEPGAGKSTLFRAMAGLWQWGTGRIILPPRDRVMFLPQRPYLPLGTLRAALSYPSAGGDFDDATLRTALEEVGLSRLAPSLDNTQRWDKELSFDEQQRLAFARILLQRPQLAVMDDAFAAVDEESRSRILDLFDKQLGDVTVIGIRRTAGHDGFYDRVVHLRRKGGKERLTFKPRGIAAALQTA